MKIIKSIQEIYQFQLSYYERLKNKVDCIIVANKDSRWHYESRIKTIESFASKIETGRFDKQQIFEDYFASTIVVKNLSDIGIAEELVNKFFDIAYRRPFSDKITHKDSFAFPFDDLRLYVSLKDSGTGELAQELYNLKFEIQIKTFLQHAWSIATHDLIYKSEKIDWGKERIAYQLKALLEHAEITISGVENLSKISQVCKENKEVKKVNRMISLILKHWQPDDLPPDRRRLAQNINTFIDAIGISIAQLDSILTEETKQNRGTKTRDLSPYMIVVQSTFYQCPQKINGYLQNKTDNKTVRILLPKEMIISKLGGNINPDKIIEI